MEKELKKLLKENKIIPFVGAGVSMEVKDTVGRKAFFSWKELLNAFADKLDEHSQNKQASYIRMALDVDDDYLSIADKIKGFFPAENLYYDALESFFDKKIDSIDSDSLRLAQSIWLLGQKLVVTTNYDKVLHWASPQIADTKFWDIQAIHEQASSLRNGLKTNTIWHLHGHIDNKKNIVLTTDSYNRLYNEEGDFKTALGTLKNYLAQKSFLFIGYSLDDKYFVDELENMCNLFQNSSSEHYILLKKGNSLPEKLKGKVISIEYEDYGEPLIEKIESLYLNEKCEVEMLQAEVSLETITQEPIKPKFCIYTASPLNEPILYKFGKIKNAFAKYEVELYHQVINEEALMDSYDFDAIFIFTKTNREKIIIEDDTYLRKSITIEELEESVEASKTYLFVDKELNADNFCECIVGDESKIYKALAGILHRNFGALRGQSHYHSLESDLPTLVDEKNLLNFVGRNTDLQNIIKKLLTIKDENRILTLKGAGGLGKTTIISKAVIEIAKRGQFKDGIKFIQCEFIADYMTFEQQIAGAFDMYQALYFRTELGEQDKEEKRLIILDNVETLLHIEDTTQIKELIKIISDYATIVITSREILKEEYEEVYELSPLSTDEAEELFTKLYPIANYDKKVLRSEILEGYLDNNPLAIKLVTKNLPKGKNLSILKEELSKSFFEITSDEIEGIFTKESDLNIQRTKSLFNSINYSYQKLQPKEKLALETLSLFPDGIPSEVFKKFYNQDMKNDKENKKKIKHISDNFSDRDIASLEDKSLIIINNQFINAKNAPNRPPIAFASGQ
ncbi:MAG: SIR2 family NAD-dependent protein deacylase [Sulfurovum sp.]